MFAIFANVLFFFKGFVFLLQLFFSLCQFLSHADCTFAAELTITLYIIRYGCRKKEGVGALKCEI